MCGRNSKVFVRSIVLISLLLLLLSSPLFAASGWAALFGEKHSESQNQESPIVSEEYSQEPLETPSEEKSNDSSMISEYDLMKLTQLSIESMTETEKLQKSLADLRADINTLESVDAISEAEYDAMSTTLDNALNANALQADKIAELEKASKTRAYIMTGGDLGFKDGSPTLGVNLSVGARIGNHFMIEAGAGYEVENIRNFTSDILNTSLDNFSFSARIGWMF